MFGFGKKKDNRDVSDIKQAVSPPEPAPMPEEVENPFPSEVENLEDEDMMPQRQMQAMSAPDKPKFAPLFVKLDRYRMILENLQEVRMLLTNMNYVFGVRKDVDKLREDIDSMLEKHVNDLSTLLGSLDKEFVRPQGAEMQMKRMKQTADIENYIVDLQDELGKLHEQLKQLKY